MARNPAWAREELILALDLYRQVGQAAPTHADVIALSNYLRDQCFAVPGDPTKFRNPDGVAMKLGNFAALDPDVPGAGLPNGGQGDKDVWDDLWPNPIRLGQTAAAIHEAASKRAEVPLPEAGEDESPEGRLLYRLHVKRERNARLVAKKKAEALATHGRLQCEVCGFDFAASYGPDGEGFIEAHHRVALSEAGESVTRLRDLALVCSNCHSILHYRRNRSVEELAATTHR